MIQVSDISFTYPGSKAKIFSHFSLSLEEGKIYGLLGKNGTGKSTLLYLLSGLLRPTGGLITVDGLEARKRQPQMLSDIFIVPEEFDLPSVSLDTYVKIYQPFYPHFSKEVMEQCLRDFELPLSLKLGELSMGQKKKAYMSLALAAGTKYLFMDEPTNGLDIPSKTLFREVVSKHMSPDRTLIISTHQVHDVESLINHVLILSESQMLLDSSMADLYERYAPGGEKAPDLEQLFSDVMLGRMS